MPRSPRLPDRLAYLEPVRKQLAAMPSEEVNEDMDTALFEEVLRERINGLAVEEATSVLCKDRDELQLWLAQPNNKNSHLHFFYGFLLIGADSVEQLLQPPTVHFTGQLQMDAPPGAKLFQEGGVWKAISPEPTCLFHQTTKLRSTSTLRHSISQSPFRTGSGPAPESRLVLVP